MLKQLIAILFSLLLAAPLFMSNSVADDPVTQQMVEDIQETNPNNSNLIEEEVKLVKYLNLPFYTSFEAPLTSAPLEFFLHDEALYKFWHFKELIQPPNC